MIIYIIFLLTGVFSKKLYGFYDLSTTNDVYYLAHMRQCYSMNPIESPEQTFYLYVKENGNKIDSTIYKNSDCSEATNKYTLARDFRRFEEYPEQVGGIQLCGKNPEAIPVYFRRENVCIFAGESVWFSVKKLTNGIGISLSYDNCEHFISTTSFECDKCSKWDYNGQDYQAKCENFSIKVLILPVVVWLFILF
ncbi:hypothetical protein ENUP19_0284G0044 [Entamoeba nuttalli]|uniref:Uncharacterized protein n=1 Tax=Entamoeba nuttalli TaxID=412467 RepID=A0ABQ0DTY6_9EUKA